MLTANNSNFEVLAGGRPSVVDAARRWIEKGYFVLPIPFRQKKPVIDNWPNLRLKPDDVCKHFGPTAQQNLGLLLGDPFGVSDIDLDSPEALKIWQNFAPATKCVFGHQSKPFSHWIYHMDPPGPSVKFLDPIDKGTLLEVRCLTGAGKIGFQTVIPPSTHKDSGEAIRYERGHDGDPANIDADALIRAAKETAAACVLARHYPPAGGRHDCELALAGVLARAGWSEEDAKMFVLAVYTAVPSHDPRAVARVSQSVEDTFRKSAEGGETTGIPRLSMLIDKRAVDAALKWLDIGAGPAVAVDANNWREHLIVSARGTVIRCVENALLSLRDKAWQGVLAFNESVCRVEALAAPPWQTTKQIPFPWQDEDDIQAAAWMQRQGILVPQQIAGPAIQAIAQDHPFNPIRDYFESLTWDGIRRIDDWPLLYLGADDSAYVRAVGSRFLIGAAARVFQPGCKNDCCLVLEGPQGLYKSTALKVLATPWFTDEVADLGSKDSSMQVHGVLIVEIAELDAMSKSEASRVKAFMSRAVDRYRPPYGKHLVEAPRESVFAGTVNEGIKYLKDETGARRFWPLKCGRIDIEALRRDRDQLWAEAVVRCKGGASWWLDSTVLNEAAEEEQASRYDGDPWQDKIRVFIENRDSVSIAEILGECIVKPAERWTQADRGRVGRCLRVFGWNDRRVGPRSHREFRFFPSGE